MAKSAEVSQPAELSLQQLVIAAFANAAACVKDFLNDLPEEVMGDPPMAAEMFTIPEQIAHLLHVLRFTMAAVRRQVFGEAQLLPEQLEAISRMPPDQGHIMLSQLNLIGARKLAAKFPDLRSLVYDWLNEVTLVVEDLSNFGPEDFHKPMKHPLSGSGRFGSTLAEFLLEMLVSHTKYHLAQAILLARIQGYPVPSPLGGSDIVSEATNLHIRQKLLEPIGREHRRKSVVAAFFGPPGQSSS